MRNSPGEHGDGTDHGAREPSTGNGRDGPRGGREPRTLIVSGNMGGAGFQGQDQSPEAGALWTRVGEERKDLILLANGRSAEASAEHPGGLMGRSRWSQRAGGGLGKKPEPTAPSQVLLWAEGGSRQEGGGNKRSAEGGERVHL